MGGWVCLGGGAGDEMGYGLCTLKKLLVPPKDHNMTFIYVI